MKGLSLICLCHFLSLTLTKLLKFFFFFFKSTCTLNIQNTTLVLWSSIKCQSESLGTLFLTLRLNLSCSSPDLAQHAEQMSPLAFHGCYTGLNFSSEHVLNDQTDMGADKSIAWVQIFWVQDSRLLFIVTWWRSRLNKSKNKIKPTPLLTDTKQVFR